ncbi:MAG: hypothetical protein ACYC61_13275 [Isosphaeraceae bacterium]
MASKTQNKPASSGAGGGSALRVEAERLIEKERYKDAVKQAKLAYKEAATPEHHRLLERAYLLRARQLLEQGMRSSAVEVAGHLLEFGVTAADRPEELIRLLASLGFEKAAIGLQDKLGASGMSEQITRTVADQLVLHPERAGSASAELVAEVKLVRQALEKLQAGDEAAAMERLRGLPRSSPLAEWKLFVRGLAAFERGDEAESRTNWDRLDPNRAPARIVGRLRRIAADAGGLSEASLASAERLAFGEPILDRLRTLGTLIAAQDWERALPLLSSVRLSLFRVDPRLAERLTFVLMGSIIKATQEMDEDEAQAVITRFTRAAQPLPIDPHWNRFLAHACDGLYGEFEAVDYWKEYLKDLETIAVFSPAERTLAQALVWNQIAEMHRDEAQDIEEYNESRRRRSAGRTGKGGAPKPAREDPDVAAAKRETVAALEESLKLAPDHLDTYRHLIEVHGNWDDEKAMVAAANRLLARFPDDLETCRLLGQHFQTQGQPRAALPHVLQARRLKPLDESLRGLEFNVRVALARQLAIEKKFDEGRAEFAIADGLGSDDRRDYYYLARKAMLEYKAGKVEAGDRLVEEAKASLVEPAPLWLALAIEAARYAMPKDVLQKYNRLWEVDAKKKRRSETAGKIAGLIHAHIAAGINYPGREEHIKQVIAYVASAGRVKFRVEDIEPIVEFLRDQAPNPSSKDFALYSKLVKAGVKQHPGSALLHTHAANAEMLAPPKRRGWLGGPVIPWQAREHLNKALQLAEASTDPEVRSLLPDIQRGLGTLESMQSLIDRFAGPFGMPFGGFPGMAGMDPFDDFDDEDEYDEDEDEIDFDPSAPFFLDMSPPPAPRKSSAAKKAKKGGRRKKK